MTQPKLAMQTGRGRFYVNRNYPERRFISVTTALKVLDRPALVGWAARTVAEEALDLLPTLVTMSRTRRADAIKMLKGRPYTKRDRAADLGTAVHAAGEAHVLGKPHAVPPEVEPYAKQYVRAIDDLGMVFEAAEATLANPDAGYAGTADSYARLSRSDNRDAVWLLDMKTSDHRPVDQVFPENAYQLAALRRCTELWLPDHSIHPPPEASRCAVLSIRADTYALIPISEQQLDTAYELFLACVRIAALTAAHKDTLFESPVHALEPAGVTA